jgi:molecular chaperone DnaK (HSP70)
MTAVMNNNNNNKNNYPEPGAWIGIDLGTSNCAAAVWDSTRGRPKVLQLGSAAIPRKGKVGRVVPSIVVVVVNNSNNNSRHDTPKTAGIVPTTTDVIVGHSAAALVHTQQSKDNVSKATVTSVKRLLSISDNTDPILQSLPMTVSVSPNNQVWIDLQPLHSNEIIHVTPVQVLALLLSEIKTQAERYLTQNIKKKNMTIPGGTSSIVSNAVIGVPAHFSSRQIQCIVEAGRLANFHGSIHTIIESTAASMAYGLFVSVAAPKHVLVLDIGGGTTDVTITKLTPGEEEEVFTVVGTLGNRQLGGDDMDICLMQVAVTKMGLGTLSKEQTGLLLSSCRQGKEALCGTDDEKAIDTARIQLETHCTDLTQGEMNAAIAVWIQTCKDLVLAAVQTSVGSSSSIDEVVLVGGATRVPAVRSMLHDVFPHISELCTSLNAETAVAQGAAIQAAVLSQEVPLSQLKSCLMLDALPYAMGVKVGGEDGTFLEILHKNQQLPAMGYATFELADARQAGVTVEVVEDTTTTTATTTTTGGELVLVGTFTFLLRRMSDKELSALKDGKRTVDIGMTMESSGKFVCSIFDEHDPEHLRKRRKFQREGGGGGALGYSEDIIIQDDDSVPLSLIVGCFTLFVLYVLAKLLFHEPEQTQTAQIL